MTHATVNGTTLGGTATQRTVHTIPITPLSQDTERRLMPDATLYLASASPRRHEILKQLQIPHRVIQAPAPEGEDEPRLPGEPPEDYVRRTAREKVVRAACWLENSRQQPDNGSTLPSHATALKDGSVTKNNPKEHNPDSRTAHYILSADTVVILDGEILGKPIDKTDAARILNSLSGKVHHVHTALALIHGDQLSEALSISTVQFKVLSDAEINNYCATEDPLGKAGAYGIQGPAAAFISHLSGSYTGVMGLPAYETTQLLASTGHCW